MPLVAAAVCPHPPLIIPEIAVGAAAETADLRSACDAAVRSVLQATADLVVLVGGGDSTAEIGAIRGDFTRWGAPIQVAIGTANASTPPVTSTISLLIGGWLLARHNLTGRPVAVATVDPSASAAECAAFGVTLADRAPRVAMLVMGDGSACRGVKAPGYDDPRAEPYDRAVARALAHVDADALLALDPALSAQLKVAGRAPWQVLAGAARTAGPAWCGTLLRHEAPYGVAYLVATWSRP